MTEDSQDVDLNVVTPPLPALPVCSEPDVCATTTSDCATSISDYAQPALNVAENSSSIPCTSALQSCANVTPDPNNTDHVCDSLLQNNSTLCEHENVKLLDGKEEALETSTQSTDYHSTFDSVSDSEGNLSVSTDETLQYSDSDSPVNVTKELSNNDDMGNQTSNKKAAPSDDDTPDEAKTKCCEIPKKKFKDRLSKASRSSKSGEDFDFEDDELYPFEGRTRSEREIVDPVELEPFEIIETDDIKFIPGAGTSDVIKSASESKFKTIPEEGSVDGDEKFDTFIIKHDHTLEQEPITIDIKDDGVGEPGTSTTTSTFEFKPAKSKARTAKQKQKHDVAEPTYANVQLASGNSRGTSRQNSNSSSNDISRKNSKEGIKKPVRKNSKKLSENVKEKIEKESKNETSKSSDVSDSKDTAKSGPFVLKQTMFSTPNPQEVGVKAKVMNEDKNVSQNSYENVNVGVMFGPQGITICNTKPSTTPTTQVKNKENIDQTPNTVESTIDCVGAPNVSGTSDTATIGRPESPLYETLTDGKDRTTDKDSTQETQDGLEAVPPSSPLALEVLEEEEEDEDLLDEDEMDEDDLIEEENKRKSAIIEFTETVCKRLSQLLDDRPEELGDDDDDKQAGPIEHIYETVRKDDVYSVPNAKEYASKDSDEIKITKTNILPEKIKVNEKTDTKTIITTDITTFTESDKRVDTEPEKDLYTKIENNTNNEKENDTEKASSVTSETCNEPSQQESSSATLTRTSGDSVKHPLPEAQGSSDDDLPDYFDPKKGLPKRDSEILYDVLDAYSEDGITEVSAKEVADIVDANTLDFVQHIQGHSTTKADKNLALPLQGFDESLIKISPNTNSADELQDRTPVAEVQPELTPLQELASASEDVPVQYDTSGRQSESDLDISEQRDDLSTDSMLADDEDEETMEILFTKTYTEPVEGGEVFLSCTVVNSAYKEEQKKSETWLSDEALEYFEANAADVMSTAFMKARKEMKDIQVCLASLRKQMEHFHDDYDDISLPDIPVDALSSCDYFGLPRKAVTD